MSLDKNAIAKRIARELHDGYYVNLGIGIPTLVANYIPAGMQIVLQSENGLLGIGPFPAKHDVDPDLINAGKQTITALPGAAFFDSSASFAMIRGGHIDVTLLGAFEVAANGDLANWDSRIPDKGPLVGGAMDLAASAKAVWVIMEHTTRKGAPRLLDRCTLPLTAPACVKRIYTDLAVLSVTPEGFVVHEIVPGVSPADLQAATGAKLIFAPDCGLLVTPDIADAG